ESLERLFVGGESPSSSALNECLRRGVPIRQIYGPTETTIWSLTNRCTSYEGGDSGARVIGYPTEETISPLIPLRESPDSKMNLYAIHAIAGSIFPYYGILLAIPKRFNVFAIEYRKEYKSRTLVDLAHFYVRQINKERRGASVYLLGHSLGGILAREMAHLMQLQSAQHSPPFVVMLDSWSVGTENLQVGAVKEYLQSQMKSLPDRNIFIDRAMNLASMLKAHRFQLNDIKIYLLKAKKQTDSTLRTIGGNKSKAVTTLWTNGWHRYSTKPIDIYLVNADHDSIMKNENARILSDIFARIFK
uniref:oleoyl-[acyl-carrier-protein] hydrolase n=1 Tax=Parascaris univalens TaxID=6257 RepID=A0A914ZQZ7_PARUN